ncbi:hypothetical protein ACG98H_03500 [Corynebacterium sp. L4756]|uniref:hypothetical protein n=1 Tax=unclassified Corynebacterium TaxID=2624378 RepID=UPI00374D5ED2
MFKSQKNVLVLLALYAVILVACRFTGILDWRSVVVACVPLFAAALSVIYFGTNWKP